MTRQAIANPFDLTGKVVLVTGANSGLGLAWATGIARAGGDVVIWGRRPERNKLAAESLGQYGVRVMAQTVDVADEGQVVHATKDAIEQMGRLDAAIANAGFSSPTSFVELDSPHWHDLLNTNLHGAYYTMREAARHMVMRYEAGDPGGSLVVCGSLTVSNGVPGYAHYGAAKGALASVTRSLAVEFGSRGIRANMVLPGRIDTGLELSPAQRRAHEDRAKVIPIPRLGTPEDCVGIVIYLLSDAAAYHTGDLITVDGGLAVKLP